MSYKKFRESKAERYTTSEETITRAEIIKKLELFLKQKQGEGQDFFDKYQVREKK